MEASDKDSLETYWYSQLTVLGEILRDKREKQHLSLQQMAERVHMNKSNLWRIEQGEQAPKNHTNARAIARGYGLSEKEANSLYQILGARPPDPALDPYWRRQIAQWGLIEIGKCLHVCAEPVRFDYFPPLCYPDGFHRLDHIWEQLDPVVRLLLQDGSESCDRLLILQLGASLPHYLDSRALYRDRLALARAAAQIAHEWGWKDIEAPLRCDAIPWTLMEEYADLLSFE